jgi:6-phosphogluconolactonase
MKTAIQIVSNADELTRAAAAAFVERAARAVQARGIFSVALSGGTTPRSIYSLLASDASMRARVPWERTHFFWGDERHVPPDHADSNYRMACEAMLVKVPVPAANIHRIKGEYADARSAADEYEADLREFFKLAPHELPRFDLVLLGMGQDGHTASLFPGTDALGERTRLVVANWVEKFKAFRITMTLPVLNNAASVIFFVSGAEKAAVLRDVLEGERGRFPSQLIHPADGGLLWLVDAGAAGLLSTSHSSTQSGLIELE